MSLPFSSTLCVEIDANFLRQCAAESRNDSTENPAYSMVYQVSLILIVHFYIILSDTHNKTPLFISVLIVGPVEYTFGRGYAKKNQADKAKLL
jgi:hypothetical protein